MCQLSDAAGLGETVTGILTLVAGNGIPGKRGDHTVHASKEEPQYLIKSDKTDYLAMHKGSALRNALESYGLTTVTFTVAPVRAGSEALLARIPVVPPATPVTGTLTLVAPAGKVTVEGTMATPVLPEFRLIVKPAAGAGPDRIAPTSNAGPARDDAGWICEGRFHSLACSPDQNVSRSCRLILRR